MNLRVISILAAVALAAISEGESAPGYTSGNVLVAHYSEDLRSAAILEYTPAGNLVGQTPIPAPPGVETAKPRDLVVDDRGRIHIAMDIGGGDRGTRTLATRNTNGAWQFNSIIDWSAQGVTYYGAMGINKDYIYAPDQTFGGDDTKGIVRYPLDDLGSPQHFPNQDFHAVKVGLNGLVYGIDRDGNAEWFHPDTMESQGRLRPGALRHGDSVISFCVDADGEYYTADLGDEINHFDKDGNFIKELSIGNAIGDIEISESGDLIVSVVNRKIVMTDRDFSEPCEYVMVQARDPGTFGRSFCCFAEHVCVPGLELLDPPITGLEVRGSDFEISFRSQSIGRYSLQSSPDLTGWETVQLGLPGTGEVLQFIDARAIGVGRRYYRIVCEFVPPVIAGE